VRSRAGPFTVLPQTIQFPNDQGIILAQVRQGFGQALAFWPGAAFFVCEDPFAARFFQGVYLQLQVLFIGGYPGTSAVGR